MLYYRLEGILVAYNHVRIQQLFGTIMTSQPDVHFDVMAEFIIFQPTPGSVLKAIVSKTEKSSVGCLVHGCFNASFFLPFHEDGNTSASEYQVGLSLTLTRMHSSRMRTIRCSGGVLEGGVCPSACWDTLIYTPPVDRMTDRCKNITLPQLRCGR